MLLTEAQLTQVTGNRLVTNKFLPHLNKYMPMYGIDTKNEMASFLAQMLYETMLFKRLEENLNYTAPALARTFPKRFANADGTPNSLARSLVGKPQLIANTVYANRMGNGDVYSGDGWLYRGRGLPMLTGKNNYIEFGFDKKPDLLLLPDNAVLVGCLFWNKKKFDELDDDTSILAETVRLNGGKIGLNARENLFKKLLTIL